MAHAAATNPQTLPLQIEWEEIERGVPLAALEEFAAYSGLAQKEFIDVVLPARTLKHRRQRGESLSTDESDRFARIVRLYNLALRVFGTEDKARKWLLGPKRRFEGRTPISLMRTDHGGRKVEEMLIQIDEGYFA